MKTELFGEIDGRCSPPVPVARNLSANQALVIAYLRKSRTVTLEEAVNLWGQSIHANKHKHMSRRFARMVNRGMIVRIKPGLFKLPRT